MSKHDEAPRAACAGMSDIFESTTLIDHNIAVRYCLGDSDRPACPIFDACRAATPGREWRHDGTWAGDLYSTGIKIREAGKKLKRGAAA